MSGDQQHTDGLKPLVCRRCDYSTEVLRTSCPHCGGDMIYAPET